MQEILSALVERTILLVALADDVKSAFGTNGLDIDTKHQVIYEINGTTYKWYKDDSMYTGWLKKLLLVIIQKIHLL